MAKFSIESNIKLPAEGWYEAEFNGYDEIGSVETKYGFVEGINGRFILSTGETVIQRILLYPGKSSLAQKLVEAVLGEVNEVEFDELIGETVAVRILHHSGEKGTYANIKDIDMMEYEDEEE